MQNIGTVHIRPSMGCSQGCKHCYVPAKTRATTELMSEEIFSKSIALIANLCRDYNYQTLRIIWHGGEPFEVPLAWYQMTEKYLKSLPVKYTEHVQTSLLACTPIYDDFIKTRLNSELGASLDLVDRMTNGSSTEYLQRWLQTRDRLRELRVLIRTLTTITPEVVMLSGEEFNTRISQYSTSIKVSKYITQDDSTRYVTNEQYSKFLIRVFDDTLSRFEDSGTIISNSTLLGAISGVLNSTKSETWGTGCLSKPALIFDSDGSVSYCLSEPNSKLGTIRDYLAINKCADESKSLGARFLQQQKEVCQDCAYQSWCLPSCHLPTMPDFVNDGDCRGFKLFLDHVAKSCSSLNIYNTIISYFDAAIKHNRSPKS